MPRCAKNIMIHRRTSGSSYASAKLPECMFFGPEALSRPGAILFLDRTFALALRTSKGLPQSRLSRGLAAEAATDGVNEASDSMTNTTVILVADGSSEREMAVEQRHIHYIFIYLRGRDFRGLNRGFVSLHSASLDIGRHIR